MLRISRLQLRRIGVCLIALTLLGMSVLLGYSLPRQLKPSERVAPRSEDITSALSVETIMRTRPAEQLVALTFDDGPDPRWTPRVLSILEKYDAKATFFVIGTEVRKYPELITREVSAGHEVGIHEWQHVDYLAQEFPELAKRLRDTRDALTSVGAPIPKLGRPPYGRLDSPALRIYADLGLDAVLWSHHFPGAQAAEARARNLASASPGMIVLAHDGRGDPTEELMTELDRFIGELTQRGYKFVTVSELRASTPTG